MESGSGKSILYELQKPFFVNRARARGKATEDIPKWDWKDPKPSSYQDFERDALVRETRIDAAHSVFNTKSIMDDVAALRRELRIWGAVVVALLAWVAYRLG